MSHIAQLFLIGSANTGISIIQMLQHENHAYEICSHTQLTHTLSDSRIVVLMCGCVRMRVRVHTYIMQYRYSFAHLMYSGPAIAETPATRKGGSEPARSHGTSPPHLGAALSPLPSPFSVLKRNAKILSVRVCARAQCECVSACSSAAASESPNQPPLPLVTLHCPPEQDACVCVRVRVCSHAGVGVFLRAPPDFSFSTPLPPLFPSCVYMCIT